MGRNATALRPISLQAVLRTPNLAHHRRFVAFLRLYNRRTHCRIPALKVQFNIYHMY